MSLIHCTIHVKACEIVKILMCSFFLIHESTESGQLNAQKYNYWNQRVRKTNKQKDDSRLLDISALTQDHFAMHEAEI